MKIQECFYRISVKALILDKNKNFLLIKEENGLWELPGGGLEHGEDPKTALVRELQEEMGLTATFIAPTPIYFFTVKNLNGFFIANILYETRVKNFNFTPSQECVEIKFFSKNEALLEQNVFPNVKKFSQLYKN